MSTDKTVGDRLKALQQGVFLTVKPRLVRGGSLQARKLSGGAVQFYFRYSHGAVTDREPIGPYDPSAPPRKLEPTAKGYSLAAALARCDELGGLNTARVNSGGLKAARSEERNEHQKEVALEVAAHQANLGRLLETYVDYLKASGRRSHYDAANIFSLHVKGPWPAVWETPAARVTPDQVIDMLRRLVESRKGRTANKLRSYLRAAYQCALDVRALASIPSVFKEFGVSANPASQTRRDARFDRADKRPLSSAEMQTYWKAIRNASGLPGASLRIHLLSGAQRIEQLVRLKASYVKAQSFTIFDTKGRPGTDSRPHDVPMLEAVAQEIGGVSNAGDFVFSTTNGRKPISATTLSKWAQELVGDSIEDFQLKRVRSGVETLLAAAKISKEDRGRLQSHGLSGVQARHYDGHEYMAEKRAALKVLAQKVGAGRYRPAVKST